MRAVTCRRYGPPDVLRIEEFPEPVPAAGEVRIRVRASTVATSSGFLRRGEPAFARLFTGLLRPKIPIPGTDLAGEVDAIGPGVTLFREGDAVVAATDERFGAHAEYACLPETAAFVRKPARASFEEATCLCEGALTALPFLRDLGRVRPGSKVLVIGASGAIGTAAVQLAKHFGAEVTGVCSGANAELVRSLGADAVIDREREDFRRNGRTYDIVFDTVGKSSFPASRTALTDAGVYLSPVLTLPLLLRSLATSKRRGRRAAFAATGLRPAREKIEDLAFLADLLDAGKLRCVIDRSYPLEEVVEAVRHVERGHKRGNVVLTP